MKIIYIRCFSSKLSSFLQFSNMNDYAAHFSGFKYTSSRDNLWHCYLTLSNHPTPPLLRSCASSCLLIAFHWLQLRSSKGLFSYVPIFLSTRITGWRSQTVHHPQSEPSLQGLINAARPCREEPCLRSGQPSGSIKVILKQKGNLSWHNKTQPQLSLH